MKVVTDIAFALTEEEARSLARELSILVARSQLDGMRTLLRVYDALSDRGLGVGMRTRSYEAQAAEPGSQPA